MAQNNTASLQHALNHLKSRSVRSNKKSTLVCAKIQESFLNSHHLAVFFTQYIEE
jgi:hypothetical protein